MIKNRGIAERLNLQLQVSAIGGDTENSGVKINRVDLVDAGEEALGKHIAL